MIVFQNEGEIDLRALKTFGVSAKESAGAIGFFGTGLKYAIAVLLREGHDFTLYVGEARYNFRVNQTDIRGSEFGIIQMIDTDGNAEDLAFTTHLGKNWEMWQAFRELYCNMKDEGGIAYDISDKMVPSDEGQEIGLQEFTIDLANNTTIIVNGSAFKDAYHNRHQIIIENRDPIYDDGRIQLFNDSNDHVYYRGIRAGNIGTHGAAFTWNMNLRMQLTEDRTLAHGWHVTHHIREFIATCKDMKLIKRVLSTGQGTYEHDISFSDYDGEVSDAFMVACEGLKHDYSGRVNRSAIELFSAKIRENGAAESASMTHVQELALERALKFCSQIGYDIKRYPVVVQESLGTGVLGLAKADTIYISLECFEMGTKTVAGTLIEEYIHLDTGMSDCTRNLQNYLLNRIITLGEQIVGEPL